MFSTLFILPYKPHPFYSHRFYSAFFILCFLLRLLSGYYSHLFYSHPSLFPAFLFPTLLLFFEADQFFAIRKFLNHPGAELSPLFKLVVSALEIDVPEFGVVGDDGTLLHKGAREVLDEFSEDLLPVCGVLFGFPSAGVVGLDQFVQVYDLGFPVFGHGVKGEVLKSQGPAGELVHGGAGVFFHEFVSVKFLPPVKGSVDVEADRDKPEEL